MQEIKCPKCGEVFQVDEAGYAAIVKQVRDKEFNKEVDERIENAVEIAKSKAEKTFDKAISEKEAEISDLKAQIKDEQAENKLALQEALAKKEKEITELKSELKKAETEKVLAVNEAKSDLKEQLAKKEVELTELKNEKNLIIKEKELTENNIRDDYKAQLRAKDEMIAFYKDFKAKQSTKMLGESLEQHCEIEFNQFRDFGFRNSYFEKDNDAKSGSKGDYIFKEYDNDGNLIVSIMFEMKNEADTTASKHKNDDFLKELDKDRREKGCEYAVLVSMLEADSDLYNRGIVDKSHKFEKMYVIRPQFFIPMITLIRNMAMGSIDYIREIAYLKAQNVDIRSFYDNLNVFKDSFTKTADNYHKKFDEAISGIESAIKSLEKIKKALEVSKGHLKTAENKVEDLSIKKLTKDSPLLQAQFNSMLITDKKKK